LAKDRADTGMDGANLDSLPKWLRDLIDLQNETAGRESGRTKRFLTSDHPDTPEAKEREKERRFTALMLRLLEPDYARLFEETAKTITRADEAAARAAHRIAQASALADGRLEALRENAAELPDGRKVFKAANGRIYAEDGSDVSALKDKIKGLTERSPSWEEFTEARREAEALENDRQEVEAFRQDVIDPAKERLSDQDNPPSEEELKEIMDGIEEKMPEAVRAEYDAALVSAEASPPVQGSAADKYLGAAPMNAPDVRKEFAAASADASPTSAAPRGPKPAP
jgi:hypothetical protein